MLRRFVILRVLREIVTFNGNFAAISASISLSSFVRRYYRLWILLLRSLFLNCSSLPNSWRDLRLPPVGCELVTLINIRSWFEKVRVLSFRCFI